MQRILSVTKLNKLDIAGWAPAKLWDGTDIFLPYSTMIHSQEDTHRPLEGRYRGQNIKISPQFLEQQDYQSRRGDDIVFNPDTNVLILPIGKFKTVPQSTKITAGKYYILLPDYPNLKLTKKDYLNERNGGSKFASTWFRLVTADGRLTRSYMHLGTKSDGCITIQYPDVLNGWSNIYDYLLTGRLQNSILTTLWVR